MFQYEGLLLFIILIIIRNDYYSLSYPSVTGNQEKVISLNNINHFAVQTSLSTLFGTDISTHETVYRHQ